MRTNSCSSCCTVLQELVLRVCDLTQQKIKPFQYIRNQMKRNNHLIENERCGQHMHICKLLHTLESN